MKNLFIGTLIFICHQAYAHITPANLVQLGSINDNTIPLVIHNMNYPLELHNLDVPTSNEQKYQDAFYRSFSHYLKVGSFQNHFLPFGLKKQEKDMILNQTKKNIVAEQNRIIREAQSVLAAASSEGQAVEIDLKKLQVSEDEANEALSKIEKKHFILSLILDFDYLKYIEDSNDSKFYLSDTQKDTHTYRMRKIQNFLGFYKCMRYLNPESSTHADYNLQTQCFEASNTIRTSSFTTPKHNYNNTEFENFKSVIFQRLLKAKLVEGDNFEHIKHWLFDKILDETVKEFDLEQTSTTQKTNKRGRKIPSFSLTEFKIEFRLNFQDSMFDAVFSAHKAEYFIKDSLFKILNDHNARKFTLSSNLLTDYGKLDHQALRLERLREINEMFKTRLERLKKLTGNDIIHVLSNNENIMENNGARDQIKNTGRVQIENNRSNAEQV